MPQKKVYIETVGCQMNVLDSELVIGALRKQGYDLTDTPADADVLLFNTCSVREHAEDKTYSSLGRVRLLKRDNPGVVIGVLGCMAQKDQDAIRKRAPYVDMVVGTGQLAEVPALVDKVKATRTPQLAVSLGRTDAGRHEVEASFVSYDPTRDPTMRPTPFQAYVRIQIGCDKFCTYCVVPSTRGPEQSRPPEHILAEVRQLVDQGCKEVTLLGQTVNSYVYEHGERRTRLSDLIAAMHVVPGLERIKFVTNYPKDMTDDLLDAVRELPKVVKYLHVPVQSGCDEMLRRMKRNYTADYYMEMLARCREMVPGVAVSSDFIVGFCGETEESYKKTEDLVRVAQFKNSFIFKKVMRIPVAGGPPQVTLDATGYPGSIRELRALDELDSGVLTTSGQPDFRCARQAGSFCVLSESDSGQVAFSTFDPVSGRIAVAATIDVQGAVSWDLSPDGSRFAVAEAGLNNRIRILPATTRSESTELSITGFRAVVSVGWAADGASLFVTGTAPEGGAIIRHVFFEGRSDLLYKVDGSLERPIQSPDGRYLSFGQATSNSNVWTIQNFEQD